MRYLTEEQIKAYNRSEIPTEDNEWYGFAGEYAEQFLDTSCQRRFVVASASSARVYVPNSCDRLRIHDCTTITSVSNNGTAVTPVDYQAYPLNNLTWAGETVPTEELVLHTGGSWYEYGAKATVTVTAAWGWLAIPDRIVQAALIVAKEIIVNRDEVKLGIIGFSDVGGVVARTNPIVRDVIRDYRRVEAWGIG